MRERDVFRQCVLSVPRMEFANALIEFVGIPAFDDRTVMMKLADRMGLGA